MVGSCNRRPWAPNYSMYGNQPRAEHLLNFRRNLLIAREMADAGIRAVPNLYWFRREDVDRYLAWLDDTKPGAVAVNLQTFRTDRDWEQMALPGLAYLATGLPAATGLIVTGFSRRARIRALLELFGDRLHLADLRPFDFDRDDERAAMGYLLGLIVDETYPETGVMLSAPVQYLAVDVCGRRPVLGQGEAQPGASGEGSSKAAQDWEVACLRTSDHGVPEVSTMPRWGRIPRTAPPMPGYGSAARSSRARFQLVSDASVLDTPQIRELSDHAPVVLDLGVSRE